MTAWGAASLVQMVSTTHTLWLHIEIDTRNSFAMSKTCLPNSLAGGVSASAIAANEAISAPGLCLENFRSWLAFRDRFDDWEVS